MKNYRIKRIMPDGEIAFFPLNNVTPEEGSAYVLRLNLNFVGTYTFTEV